MIEVIAPDNEKSLKEFARFPRQVYRTQKIHFPVRLPETLSFLKGQNPFARDRDFHILLARGTHGIIARAVAVNDRRYQRHWNEQLGHLIMLEVLPHCHEESRSIIDAASEWLGRQGATAVRAGFGPFEPGFIIDQYEEFVPRMGRHNPSYYHSLLKNAGFETEKGASEYVIQVNQALTHRYQQYLQTAEALGFRIVPLRNISGAERVAEVAAAWNAAYASHWGLAPVTEDEFAMLLDEKWAGRVLDLSALAYAGNHPVGVSLVRPGTPEGPFLNWWHRQRPSSRLDKLDSFAVGVSPSSRGKGLSVALAAHAFLQLISQGVRNLSYGLVVDDNWPSRRVAASLGAYVHANYLTYRKAIPQT